MVLALRKNSLEREMRHINNLVIQEEKNAIVMEAVQTEDWGFMRITLIFPLVFVPLISSQESNSLLSDSFIWFLHLVCRMHLSVFKVRMQKQVFL